MPFRDAHHVTGTLVKMAETQGVQLHELPLEQMQGVEPRITAEVLSVLTLEASVNSRQSLGGTAPVRVKQAITAALSSLGA
jgi:argininosuccinate lyase